MTARSLYIDVGALAKRRKTMGPARSINRSTREARCCTGYIPGNVDANTETTVIVSDYRQQQLTGP